MVKVFISYARADALEFADWLADELEEAGIDVWLDRSDISAGQAWASSIQEAISACTHLIAVMSPSSIESRICPLEVSLAFTLEKTIIPVMLKEVTPPFLLINLHYLPFTDRSEYEGSLNQLISLLAEASSRARVDLPSQPNEEGATPATINLGVVEGRLVNVPALPPNFKPRPDQLDLLRERMTNVLSGKPMTVTSLGGMGGIGKSVLAAAVCRDPLVRLAHPDGIYWISIGRDPLLTAVQAQLCHELGDSEPQVFQSTDEGIARLKQLLHGKRILIVLDDVWTREHVMPFMVDSPGTHLLLTTRNKIIASELGAAQTSIYVLSPHEATQLLAEVAGYSSELFPEVAAEMGYLPLALRLAGATLRETEPAEFLRRLKELSSVKVDHSAAQSLALSFDVSLQELSERERILYNSLGIFPEGAQLPLAVIVRLWIQLEPSLSPADCLDLLSDIEALELIQRRRDEGTFELHELLVAYNRDRIASNWEQLHRELLSTYEQIGQPWTTVPDDGYLHHMLFYHLIEAGRQDDLINLLVSSPDWMNTKFLSAANDFSYIADLDLALGLFTDPLDLESLSTVVQLHMARQVACHRTSQHYIDSDLAILSSLGRRDEALKAARLRNTPWSRFRGLVVVYEALRDKDQSTTQILEEAETVVNSMPDDASRTELLRNLSQIFASVDEEHALRCLLEARKSTHRAISPLSGEPQPDSLMDTATVLAGKKSYYEALVALGPRRIDEFLHILANWSLPRKVTNGARRIAKWV
jgi:hypothetical protein